MRGPNLPMHIMLQCIWHIRRGLWWHVTAQGNRQPHRPILTSLRRPGICEINVSAAIPDIPDRKIPIRTLKHDRTWLPTCMNRLCLSQTGEPRSFAPQQWQHCLYWACIVSIGMYLHVSIRIGMYCLYYYVLKKHVIKWTRCSIQNQYKSIQTNPSQMVTMPTW